MFFLTTYGVLNITAGMERFLGSPSFRPKFKVHWVFSLLGAIGCIAIMFLINTGATITALLFVAMVYIWLERRELQSTWGDIGRGVWMAVTRAGLMRLSQEQDPKTWRPNPLVLVGSPKRRWYLIDFADQITHKRGILTVASVIEEEKLRQDQIKVMKQNIKDLLDRNGIQGLVKIIASRNRYYGVQSLVQSYGLGELEPNTIILGDNATTESRSDYCEMIRRFHELQRNVLVVKQEERLVVKGRKLRMDIWWGGLKGNGGFMMIIAFLMKTSRSQWREAQVTIKLVVDNKQAVSKIKENMNRILEQIRIHASVEIIPSEGRSFDDILLTHSGGSDMVFLGMATPDEHFEDYYVKMINRIKELPTVILALAAQNIAFGEVLVKKEELKEKG
jgi:hypothetical protein